MLAVIKTGGKQYKVQPGTILRIEKLEGEVGSALALDEVLFVNNGSQTLIGTPFIEQASVQAEILKQGRADKVLVFKKKRRQNYRRCNGHRQSYTLIKITQISAA